MLATLAWFALLLTPQHGGYDTGYWWVPPWPIEKALHPDGRFISFRQGIFGGNFLGAYWLPALALPVVSGYRALRGGGSLALLLGATFGTIWFCGYHVIVLIAAVPGWGALAAFSWFVTSFLTGLLWQSIDRRASG